MPDDESYLDQFGEYLKRSAEGLSRIPRNLRSYYNDLPSSSGDYGSALTGGPTYAADQATRLATRGQYGYPDVAKALGGTGEAAQQNIDRFRSAYAPVGQAAGDVGTFLGEGSQGGVKVSPSDAWTASEPARSKYAEAATMAGARRNIMIGPVGVENLFHAGRPAAKRAFEMADSMAARGHTRQEIWDATAEHFRQHDPEFAGVHYGPDGLPRVELSDAGVPWTGSTQETLKTGGVDMTEPVNAWPHHTLYQAYPEMRDSGLLVINPPPGTTKNYASFDPRNKSFALNLNKEYTPGDMLSHEAQHYGQTVENSLSGSNPREWTPKSTQVEKVLNGSGATPEFTLDMIDAARAKMGFTGKTASELRDWAKKQDLSTEDLANNISGYIGREKYRRTYGETEARNAQTRYHMNAEERRQTPPWKTLDYPENKLITEY